LFKQQMQYNQISRKDYYPLLDKVKAYLLSINLSAILKAAKLFNMPSKNVIIDEELISKFKEGFLFSTLEQSDQI